MRHFIQFTLSSITLAALLITLINSAPAQDKAAASSPQKWTLKEALAQLRLHPQDAYLQYVALQLARREGRLDEIAGSLTQAIGDEPISRTSGRRESVDLFSLFTGALAVQESLQLDAMRSSLPGDEPRPDPLRYLSPAMRKEIENSPERKQEYEQRFGPQIAAWEQRQAQVKKRRGETVPIARLSGPAVKSHSWTELLAGRKPEISPLASYVPEDFYFIEFRSLTKLLDVVETSDLWGAHLFNQVYREARSHNTSERLKRQLALETHPQLEPFYDLAVEDVAVTGSDPFLREGSDVSLLFRVKSADLFRTQMENFLVSAERSRSGVKRSEGNYLGVEYIQLTTPDREINVFAAYPAPGLHLRSNSLPAFQRLIEMILGRTAGQSPRSLGASAEFAYIRTLMPRGAKEEDGFIYLSDPFIRRLMSPQLRLTERRRVLCYNHIRMIGHAALLYRTETGKAPASLSALAESQCAPGLFGETVLACPDGGQYSLAADGMTGVCSHHGHARFLTPCIEIPVTQVSGVEADEYRAFIEEYNQYWRTFFDPIALRVQLTPKQYRLETIILPLIDNSIYTRMAEALGGEVEPLDSLPVPRRNIFSVALRLNKEKLLAKPSDSAKSQIGTVDENGGGQKTNPLGPLGLSDTMAERLKLDEFLNKGLGNQLGLHVYDSHPTFDLNLPSLIGMLAGSLNGQASSFGGVEMMIGAAIISLNSPVYVALPVQDAKSTDQFLERLDDTLAVEARKREGVSFLSLDEDFYRFQLKQGQTARSFGLRFGPIKLRIFWARIGNGLYVASKQFILDDLCEAESATTARDPGPAAHAMGRIRPQNWNQTLADFQLGWAENNREACLNNLGPLSSIGRAFTDSTLPGKERSDAVIEFADRIQAVHSFCPEGGRYLLSPDGKTIECSVHGSAGKPRQPIAPTEANALGKLMRDFADLTATLTFMPEGLRAVVTIDRK